MQGWSPGTDGPVSGPVVILPDRSDTGALEAFFASAQGKFVLMSQAEPNCRPMSSWEEWATPETLEKLQAAQDEARWPCGNGWAAAAE